ncbi:N-terminal acetyltransferase [Actinomortierella ambigua]|nr:N-terminal acetyltransferase [Actinomortierella ambigua]
MSVREEDKRLTREQTFKVLHHIGFPLEHPDQLPPPTLATLTELQYRCIITIPFETLSLRMTRERHVDISLDGILDRVLNKKRGGMCLSNNRLAYELILSLGFQAQWVVGRGCQMLLDNSGGGSGDSGGVAASKKSSTPVYRIPNHRVTIVHVRDDEDKDEGGGGEGGTGALKKYVVDVGWGSSFYKPLELRDGAEIEYFGHRRRMTQVAHPDSRNAAIGNPPDRMWRVDQFMGVPRQGQGAQGDEQQCKQGQEGQEEDQQWKPLFAFTEQQAYEIDAEMVNWYVCHSPSSIFYTRFWCIRGTADGTYLILMQDKFKIRSSRGVEFVKICKTEEEREQILAEYFGIVITDEERTWNDQKLVAADTEDVAVRVEALAVASKG